MSSYTCISCRVAFADGDLQRAHYKSDWHRYNLKRKVADMPPVNADDFRARVLSQRGLGEDGVRQAAGEVCALCRKKFSSANAFNDHLRSQRHLATERRRVEEINRKNLEKGLGADDKADRDARNATLRRALGGGRREEPPEGGGDEAGAAPPPLKTIPEKPPRQVWLEEQAKRREREEDEEKEEKEEEEGEWEDMDDDDNDEEGGEEEEEEENMDEDEEEEKGGDKGQSSALPGSIPVTECLFCTQRSKTLVRNVAHMTRVHGFFIPDLPYLADLQGLIRYLGEKVGAGNVCLWCNQRGRSFYSTQAVRAHMDDKSHRKLFTDGDAALEFADFYDFRSSYPDRGGDDDDGDDELPDDKDVQYDDETMELVLPSGSRVGHRSLMRYYKQRFGTERTLVPSRDSRAVGRVLRHYKALGWTGHAGPVGVRGVRRDMQFVQMMKSKWMLKMGMNHNTTRQKHFRAQVMF